MSTTRNTQIARRYAEALFVASSASDRKVLAEEFKKALTVLEDPAVRGTFHHPLTSRGDKSELIRLMKLSPTMENFLLLIVEKSRERFLTSIEAHFESLVLEEQQTTIAEVTSAIPLTTETLQKLELKLGALIGKTILLQTKVNPDIGGGMIIKADGKVIDASINHKLKQVQSSLNA